MDRAELEAEVRRLAPWYYRWDLRGVRTDSTAPCDDQGHREVSCPPIHDGFWTGKTVLDVACNEGAYGIGALGHGAGSLVGFDCRAVNIEKARLVARVLGFPNARFEVADCDSFVAAHPGARFDIVLMCGILYHLTDPRRVIADYSELAAEWIFVTSCVQGVPGIGFTSTTECDNIAASRDALPSLMPNNADTLIEAFRRHGFEPVHVEEVCKADFFDGVNLLLRNCREPSVLREADDGGEVDVFLAPCGPAAASDFHLAVYNRTERPRRVRSESFAIRADGAATPLGSEELELPPRSTTPGVPASRSVHRVVTIPAADAVGIEVRVLVEGRRVGGTRVRRATAELT